MIRVSFPGIYIFGIRGLSYVKFSFHGERCRQSRRVDLSADSVETRAFVFKIISRMVVFLSSRGYDLAARGEFMRKSGAGVIPEPREVNYSTSGRAGGRQLPTKEYEQSSLMKIIRAGSSSTMARETRENPARRQRKTRQRFSQFAC